MVYSAVDSWILLVVLVTPENLVELPTLPGVMEHHSKGRGLVAEEERSNGITTDQLPTSSTN